jgi:hypothetical protein
MSENKDLTCSCCKLVKSKAEFHKNKAHKTGFANQLQAADYLTKQRLRLVG